MTQQQNPGPSQPVPTGATPTPLRELPDADDLRLVVADMDGTLLDEHSRVPVGLWELLDAMTAHGIVFAPASGRQYATLHQLFETHAEAMVFIAENGTYVVRDESEVASTPLSADFVVDTVQQLRQLAHEHHRDLGIVVCGKLAAWVDRTDAAFLHECEKYYVLLNQVDDVLEPVRTGRDEVLKIAIYDFGDGEHGTAPHLAHLRETHQVVVSGEHWIDIMSRQANKGVAVAQLQQALGVTPAQTAVFGDYLNDYELMGAGDLSFAMANAHPDVVAAARFVAPANTDAGVLTVLRHLLRHRLGTA